MTNKEIVDIAMRQSAIESGCTEDDFKSINNIVVESVSSSEARHYLELPFICDFTSYGTNIVASCKKEYMEVAEKLMQTFPKERMFETPMLYDLNREFEGYGVKACFQACYYLPDVNMLDVEKNEYELRIMKPEDFVKLYDSKNWNNALTKQRRELDVLGIGAYNKMGDLMGMAACSKDCERMWQLGYDVLPEYRGKGIGNIVTKRLTKEIMKRGKVPFARVPWCNVNSMKNMFNSGYKPAWVQLTFKSNVFIEKMVKYYSIV